MMKRSAIVIGAGIVGLATARALAVRGYTVSLFERNAFAIGASIRNFGMIWPIGQATGPMFEQAMLSRSIWKQVCLEAKIWHNETGSLHLANHDDELQVIQEYVEANHLYRNCYLLDPEQAKEKSPILRAENLKGALWSEEEMIIESRLAIQQIATYLDEKYNVHFYWNTAISRISGNQVFSNSKSWEADEIFVCSGADFETLYPEIFVSANITKCKLQMLRLNALSDQLRIGPSLCGGLSLIHYPGFKSASSLSVLLQRYENEYADYLKWGIHVMVSQNGTGELTVGDSHEYGLTHDPFDKSFINEMILRYLQTFTTLKDVSVMQTWQGIYPKMLNGESSFITQADDHVTIINGLGGNGMTLSFGLCEQAIASRSGNGLPYPAKT